MTSACKLGTISMVAGAGLLLALGGCQNGTGGNQAGPAPAAASSWQGWDSKQRLAWYQAGQGSRLMPWAWAKVLEQKDSDQPFLADANMAKFRFLALPE